MSDPAIIEAAARALNEEDGTRAWRAAPQSDREWYANLARAALAAVTPLIRATTLEEAALTIEARLLLMDDYRRDLFTVRDGAAAIRVLKEQP